MILCPVIFGPTASGKSAAAAALAKALDGIVVNADSMQVYRDLRLLTARPSEEEEAAVPHRLYGILDGDETCSAADWRRLALAEIDAAAAAGKVPILCGGTGFYIKALTDGLSPMPAVPDAVRDRVRREVAEAPGVSAWDRLEALDPAAAARIEPMDRQRISRALEIFEATGRPLSEWQALPAEGPPPDLHFLKIALRPPRSDLVARCDARFDRMMEEGAPDEVAALKARGLSPERPIMRAVGVPELIAYLEGEVPLDAAVADAKTATRRYAKRQMTWMKGQYVADFEVNEQFSESLVGKIFSFIEENGLISL